MLLLFSSGRLSSVVVMETFVLLIKSSIIRFHYAQFSGFCPNENVPSS